MTKYQKLFDDIKHTGGYKTVGEDIDYKVSVDSERQEIILQFQESKGSGIKPHNDWWHNFAFIPFPLRLENKIVWTTLGYACAYKSAKNIPMNEFLDNCERYPKYKKIIRGRSFGSVMTKIAVRHYHIKTKKMLDEELTYGDVKVWLNPFVRWLADNWVFIRHEFTSDNDIVTWCVPFYHRTRKCDVGGKFTLKKLLKTAYNHQHYEEYNYVRYELIHG